MSGDAAMHDLGIAVGAIVPTDIRVRRVSSDDWEAFSAELSPAAREWLSVQGFAAETGKVARLPGDDGRPGDIVIGAARADDPWSWAALAETAAAGRYVPMDAAGTDLTPADLAAAAFGWALGCYSYRDGATKRQRQLVLSQDTPALDHILAEARALHWSRRLVDTPGNLMGPNALEREIAATMEALGATVSVIRGDDLLTQGFPGIHVVGAAAPQAPRLLEAVWGSQEAPEVTIIGKGVTFDTGGLNIKAFAGIRHMKRDMGGAAVAAGLAAAVIGCGLPIRLRLLVPIVENVIGKDAFRPGDVLDTRSGKTIEVENTDCEGRIILADCLTLATEGSTSPDLVIDLGTLTGSARTALGGQLQAMFTPDDDLARDIQRAGISADDPVWQMPLWDGYAGRVRGTVGDLINMAPGAYAGAITAALFLREFTNGHPRWVHFDISAWNDTKRPGRPVGGEGTALRALLHTLKQRYV